MIEDHDSVIWLGDFNYRIGLPNDKVRQLVEIGDLQTLYDNDQVRLQSCDCVNTSVDLIGTLSCTFQ